MCGGRHGNVYGERMRHAGACMYARESAKPILHVSHQRGIVCEKSHLPLMMQVMPSLSWVWWSGSSTDWRSRFHFFLLLLAPYN